MKLHIESMYKVKREIKLILQFIHYKIKNIIKTLNENSVQNTSVKLYDILNK